MILGEGEREELLDQAMEQGIDVLVLFESEVKQNVRTGFVNNETEITVLDVRRRERVFRTRGLDNIAVQKQRADDDEEDPVAIELDKLFEQFVADDQKSLKMTEFPEGVSGDLIKARIAQILGDEQLPALAVLSEIKYYHSRGMIDDATLTKSFQKLLGETDGAKLAEGDNDERLEALATLLPAQE
jgi:hypothetical protein